MGEMVCTRTGVLSGCKITYLGRQIQHHGAQRSYLLHGGVGQAPGSPHQDHGLLWTGTFFLLPLTLLYLPGPILLLHADPILVLQAGKLILVLPTLRLHLPIEILLTLGQIDLTLSVGVLNLIT